MIAGGAGTAGRRGESPRSRGVSARGGRPLRAPERVLDGGALEPVPIRLGDSGDGPVRAFRLTARVERTATSSWTLPARSGLLVVNRSGALALRPETRAWAQTVPPATAWIGASGRTHVRAAKGIHDAWLLVWPLALTPLLEPALGQAQGSALSLQLGLAGAADRLALALEAGGAAAPLSALGVVYEVAAAVSMRSTLLGGSPLESDGVRSAIRLTPWPEGMPPAIAEIAGILREEAAEPWDLRRAAARAGYSPHHFSRLFKATFGFGFQGFLERVRTEAAVELLQTTLLGPADVAARAGLGTPAKMRDALRSHLGFAPADLRQVGL